MHRPCYNSTELKEVVDVISGYAFPGYEMSSSGSPIIKIKNIIPPMVDTTDVDRISEEFIASIPKLEKFRLKHKDILVAMTGATVGKIGRFPKANEIFYLNQRVARVDLRNPTQADIDYIYYVLSQTQYTDQISSLADGSAQANVSASQIGNITIPLPPLPEQRRIAHILGTLDDKIENNRKTAKTLEAMVQAIFKSWFVDFDPVRAKMNGESRESICKRLKITPEILDLFPDRLVDSELGEIPEGWGNFHFSECVTIIGGGTPKTSVLEYWDGNIPWFSIVGAPTNDGIWVVDTEKKISESGLNHSSTRKLPIGTTIITARGTVDRVALVGVPMTMNQSCYGLRGKYDERGFFTHFSTRLIIQELRQHAHGSVFDTITRDTLGSIEVTFESTISSPMEMLKQYNEEIYSITMLRDTLLPKLISGEIRVPDAQAVVDTTTSISKLFHD
ncbi:MAG: restriction endonuclease subunit S [Acidithiobacillus sp.]